MTTSKKTSWIINTRRRASVTRPDVALAAAGLCGKPDPAGTLVTDCYSGYHAHVAGAKQKCLAHVARRARDWQRLTQEGSAEHTFFEDVKQWVKRGCEFHRLRGLKQLSPEALAAEGSGLREELSRLENCPLEHDKAQTLQARLLRHHGEWLVFVDDARVPPTNNLAERKLRPLVVLRKITFGHRSESRGKRMARIMTIKETAKAHRHKASDYFLLSANAFRGGVITAALQRPLRVVRGQ